MFELYRSDQFEKNYKKLTKKDEEIKTRIEKTLNLLGQDPAYPSLKTHKLEESSKYLGIVFSSWITCDLRAIWCFLEQIETESSKESSNKSINLLNIGGHSTKNSVYK